MKTTTATLPPCRNRRTSLRLLLPPLLIAAMLVTGCGQSPENDAAASGEVAASELKRVKTVPPKFPKSMAQLRRAGWVDMKFTVDTAGKVKDIEVTDSHGPPEMLDSAVAALSQWRFEPTLRDGRAVEQRAYIKLQFDPNMRKPKRKKERLGA